MPDKLSVLRACHAVLKTSGRIAGYTIHLAPGLSQAERERAVERGPSAVASDAPYEALLEAAGLPMLVTEDVTPEYEATIRAILEAWDSLEHELRRSMGDEAYETERDKKMRALDGVAEGLLKRSLHVAVRD